MGSILKIMVFWFILCTVLVSTGEVNVVPDFYSRYVTNTSNGTVDVNYEYVGNLTGVSLINPSVEGANATNGSSSFTSGTNSWSALALPFTTVAAFFGTLYNFFTAPVQILYMMGMPQEIVLVLGVLTIIILLIGIVSALRGYDL